MVYSLNKAMITCKHARIFIAEHVKKTIVFSYIQYIKLIKRLVIQRRTTKLKKQISKWI